VCYYGGNREVLKTADVQMLILDADTLGAVTSGDKAGRICLGYLSVGEAQTCRWYWDEVKGASWVLSENPNWGGDHLVDLRSAAWRELVVKREARRLVERGYDGFFLDTLDTAEVLLQADGKRFAGVEEGLVRLVAELRREYPGAVIVANRGFSVLDGTAPLLDGLMVEGVRSTYDFEAKRSRRLSADEIAWMDARLAEVKRHGLPVFALDYVEPPDADTGRRVEAELRRIGCRPFVSVVKLDTFPGERKGP